MPTVDAAVLGARAVAALVAIAGVATIPSVARCVRQRHPDVGSGILGIAAILGCALLLWRDAGASLPLAASVPVLVLGVLSWLVRPVHARIRRHLRPVPFILEGEQARKGFHLVLGLVALAYVLLGQLLMRVLDGIWVVFGLLTPAAQRTQAHEAVLALASGPMASAGHVAAVAALSGTLLLMVPQDLARLWDPDGPYPLRAFTERRLRSRERGAVGHHVHIVSATLASLLLLGSPHRPAHLLLAVPIVLVTVLADAASALAGIRWGRRRLPHNPGKTYVGSVAGLVVAFLAALPFVGWGVAAAVAVAFLAVDLLAPVPLPVCDNLLNPTVVTACLLALEPSVHPLY